MNEVKKYYNVIYNKDRAYKILRVIPIHNFLNKNQSLNQKVLGLYVNEIGGNHVLQNHNNFIICQEIEDAQIIN